MCTVHKECSHNAVKWQQPSYIINHSSREKHYWDINSALRFITCGSNKVTLNQATTWHLHLNATGLKRRPLPSKPKSVFCIQQVTTRLFKALMEDYEKANRAESESFIITPFTCMVTINLRTHLSVYHLTGTKNWSEAHAKAYFITLLWFRISFIKNKTTRL